MSESLQDKNVKQDSIFSISHRFSLKRCGRDANYSTAHWFFYTIKNRSENVDQHLLSKLGDLASDSKTPAPTLEKSPRHEKVLPASRETEYVVVARNSEEDI